MLLGLIVMFVCRSRYRKEPWAGVNPFAIAVQVGGNGRRLDISALEGTW